ncbi:MAG: hypothetical protein QG604_844 [Candidatus Dependentiae bacterium]|nr:hypothetical protein [Candidatus Dependentiae bacterium]
MIVRPAFSLIELMVALALSAVIMLGLVQANRNAARLLREAQSLLVVNRQVALLYNQLERDVTAAMVYQKPVKYAPARPEKKKEGGKEGEAGYTVERAATEEKSIDDAKKKEKDKHVPSCTLEAFDDSAYKVGGKKWQQTKKFTFISTTPLEVYEQEHERSVRVGYELVFDKKLSTPQKSAYTLYRMQTDELENVLFKEEEDKKTKKISRCVVADHIKQFSLEASYEKRAPEKSGTAGMMAPVATRESEEKAEPVKTFTWGEKEEKELSKTVLPELFATHIELWDAELHRSYSFTSTFPIFVKADAKPVKKEGEKKEAVAPVTPPVEAGHEVAVEGESK